MQKVKNEENNGPVNIEKMFEAGVHYGYKKSKRHPSVSSFIYTTKNSGDIINLEKTGEMLNKALEFVKDLASANKTILLVGTKAEARETIKNTALSLNLPYVNIRWIGGTLSNFGEIKRRIAELEKYNKEVVDGTLDKYTKKERLVLSKKMEKLSKYYSGLLSLKKVPDALFIIDPKAEKIAKTEANKEKIPVIALANSDTNIKDIKYPILGNDSSLASIKLFANAFVQAYKAGNTTLK